MAAMVLAQRLAIEAVASGYATGMEIVTNRFVLRDFREEDASAFEAYHADPRSVEFYGAEQVAAGHARRLLKTFMSWAAESPRRNYQLAVIHRQPPHLLIGCCGLRRAGSEEGRAELGIELAPKFWGRYGYAIEVMGALVEFGFRNLRLREIYGRTASANARIARLVSAFGAVPVNRPAPGWMAARGRSQIEWQLTKDQWKAAAYHCAPVNRLKAGD
jgi:ribosomal-protein-alanine N-acetyltransferase